MDTNVLNVDQDYLADIFPELTNKTPDPTTKNRFGGEVLNVDILDKTNTDEHKSLSEQEDADTKEDTKNEGGELQDVDILSQTSKPPTELKDLSSYFEDRIKSGKFFPMVQENDNGEKVPFIPKTPEEFDEAIELQLNHRMEQVRKDLENSWYEGKSPAWKLVSKYAEMVDDPSEIIPFIESINTIQSVADIDENDIEGAEKIVRARLLQKGDPPDLIEEQIEALKTTDKLISTAKQYKPIIIQQEQDLLAAQMKEKNAQKENYLRIISEIREGAINEIEKPLFGKFNLKQEEKAAIYDLIGEPSEENHGYGIYTAIDNLFEKRDFKTLKEIALLLSNSDSFYKYLGTNVANQTAVSLERKLRIAADSRTSSSNDYHEEVATIQRNQYKRKPAFGR